MSTSAASPDDLRQYLVDAGAATEDLSGWVTKLGASYTAFQNSGSQGVVTSGTVESTVPALLGRQQEDDTFVGLVREAFLTADSGSLANGVVSLTDAALQAAYERAARSHGLDPARLDANAAPLTVPPAQTGAIPQDSGFVNDPVCTATGHFLEAEEDLVMPAPLDALRWPRRYSSRLLTAGAFGRGWSSWAEVRLVAGEDGDLHYHGPDGQDLRLGDDGAGGWVIPAALAATVARDGDDLVLTWDSAARFGPQRWRFAADGTLSSVWGPQLGTTTFSYRDGRLAGLRHDGGRTLALGWAADRVERVEASDGRVVRYRYDAEGDLVAVDRPDGGRRYEPDGLGRIVTVQDADGVRLCHNTYDQLDRVVRQVSPLGRETLLEYLPGRATRVSDTAGGPTALYEHDTLGRLVGLVNGDGDRYHRRFDERGRVVDEQGFDGSTSTITATATDAVGIAESAELCHAGGESERWGYDTEGRVVAHERDGGRITEYRYDGDSLLPCEVRGPLGWSLAYEWRDGLPVSVTDADGVRVTFEHDAEGNLVASTDALGAVTRIDWHRSGRPAVVRHPDGTVLRMDWDDAGRLLALVDGAGGELRMDLSPAGRLRAVVDPEGGRTEVIVGTDGAVERVIDPLGRTTELRIDQFELLAGFTNPDGAKWDVSWSTLGIPSLVTGPDGSTWSSTLDAEGRIHELVDPLGHTVRRRHDAAGRLEAFVDQLGGETTFRYDEVGNLIESTDPAGAVTRLAWDALDRLVATTDPDGVTGEVSYTPAGHVTVTRDGAGQETRHSYDDAGRLVAVDEPGGGRRRYGYDGRGRVVAVTTPAGRTTTYDYDDAGRMSALRIGAAAWRWHYDRCGRVVAVIDPLGATTRFVYDLAGQLTTAIDPRGGRVQYRYDDMGNMVAALDPFGRAVTAEHDAMGRLRRVTDQLGRTTHVTHDANGRLVSRTGPGGERIGYRRDPRGLIITLLEADTEAVRYQRDARGLLVAVHEPAAGRRSGFEWSPAARLRAATNGSRALSYHWNTAGSLVRRDAHDDSGPASPLPRPLGPPGVRSEVYDHDHDGRLVAVTADGFGTVRLERDADGLLTGLAGAGVERAWTHDDAGLPVAYRQRLAGGPWRATTLRRDARGGVTDIDVDGAVTRCRYDEAGQLVAVDGPDGRRRFSYDAAGRLADETGPAGGRRFAYDAAHQLRSVAGPDGTTRYRYDTSGRRVAEHGPRGERRFDWDARGRLRAVTHDGRVTRLDVDALGNLDAVGTTRLWWDPVDPVTRPVAIGDRVVLDVAGQVLAEHAGGEVVGHDADWRGSVAVRDEWGRDPAGPGATGTRPADPALGLTGEVEMDGLVWLRHRVYDPATAAFLSPDPLPGVPGTAVAANPYHFGANDPIGNVDPLGLKNQPLSIDDYNAARDRATGVQWGNIAKVGLMVAGVAASILIPGGGLLLSVAIGAGIGAVMGAGPAVIDGITTGHWDTGAIIKGGLMGAVAGGIGGAIPGGQVLLNSSAGLLTRVGVNAAVGTGSGAVTGFLGEAYDLTGMPGSDGRFDPGTIAQDALIGGATGGGLSIKAKGSLEGATALQAKAADVNGLRNPWMAERGTTSVVKVRNWWGKEELRVATEAPKMPKELGGQTLPGKFVEGNGHAEKTIFDDAGRSGWKPVEGGTSRNVCQVNAKGDTPCNEVIEGAGLKVDGPPFKGNADKTPYRMFW